MAKILIPTPLRPYTDKQDAVDAAGATVGELLADLTRKHAGLKAHLYNEQGKLRSFVNIYVNDEDIRYLQKEQTPVKAGDTVSIIPSVAGGARPSPTPPSRVRIAELPELTNDEIKRYCRHLIMPEVGVDGQRKLKASRCSASARADSDRPPRCISPPPASARSASSTSTSSTSATCSGRSCTARRTSADSKLASAKDRLNAINPERGDRDLRDGAVVGERAEAVRAVRRHPRRHRQFSDALSRQRRLRAARQAERVRQHLPLRRTGVGVWRRRTARAIAACIPSRRRPASCRAARKAACSACCRGSSA